MSNSEVLNFVFESGRIASDSSNWDEYIAEVEVEVEFEARERLESGELEGTVEECVKFALTHVG
jgi:hypothetical protein